MPRDDSLKTISVNLPVVLVERLRSLGFHERLSASAVVESALVLLFDDESDRELGKQLRANGATLRRP